MKIENHSAYLLDPATKKGQSYKFEVKYNSKQLPFFGTEKV